MDGPGWRGPERERRKKDDGAAAQGGHGRREGNESIDWLGEAHCEPATGDRGGRKEGAEGAGQAAAAEEEAEPEEVILCRVCTFFIFGHSIKNKSS